MVPKKVSIFLWRALRGRLPVRVELDKRGVDLDSVLCPSCDNNVETCAHCLITCDLAMSMWVKIFNWWNVGIVNAFTIDEVFSSNGNINVPYYYSHVWKAVIWTTGFKSILDEGDMAFLRKMVKSGAAVGKRVLLQIIMAHLPPPNNDLNVPEDEHAPAPEHAPIAPNPVPIQPNDYLADDDEEPEEEEEPIPEQAHVAPAGFAPQWIGWHDPNNNNGWIEEDDEEEVESEEEDKEEMEAEEDEDIEVEDNDDENDGEIIHPYEEADPLNRTPPSPETAEQEFMNAPVSRSTLQPIPSIWQFTGTFYVGEGSSATVFNPALCKVYPLDLWFRVESSPFERLRRNDMRMDTFDDDMTTLDSTLREQIQEMKKLMAELNEHGWEYRIRNQLPLKRRYRKTPYDPSINTTSRPRRDDPYVMVRDNAVRADVASDCGGESVYTTAIVKDAGEENDDEGDDAAASKDSQPSESRGSPRDP
ncbi:putative reverse transcriptase domain-containing protein [Tanacetum coccineum]